MCGKAYRMRVEYQVLVSVCFATTSPLHSAPSAPIDQDSSPTIIQDNENERTPATMEYSYIVERKKEAPGDQSKTLLQRTNSNPKP